MVYQSIIGLTLLLAGVAYYPALLFARAIVAVISMLMGKS